MLIEINFDVSFSRFVNSKCKDDLKEKNVLKRGKCHRGTVQENGFNAVISDDFSKLFPNFSK